MMSSRLLLRLIRRLMRGFLAPSESDRFEAYLVLGQALPRVGSAEDREIFAASGWAASVVRLQGEVQNRYVARAAQETVGASGWLGEREYSRHSILTWPRPAGSL